MEIDDRDFQVVRKNLNILSVLIMMLAFTNAQINQLNFLGIDMKLDGSKLYLALFIGYLYFTWRFLTKLPLMGGFWNDFSNYFLESDNGVKRKHNFEKYKQYFINKSDRLKSAIETNDKSLHLVELKATRTNGLQLTKLKLVTHFTSVNQKGIGDQTNFWIEHDIQVSKFYVIKKLIIFCFKYDRFGDYLFPLIPVIINAGFFLLKKDWQGSIYLIFNNRL